MAYWPGCLLVTAGFLCLLSLTGLAYCGLLAWLFAAYWSGLLAWLIMASWPGCLLLPDQAARAYCRLLDWLIVAYWPGYLRLTGQAYYGLLAWLFHGYCRLLGLIAAYWPGLLWLTGLINCSLLIRLIELAYCGLLA